MTGAGLVRFVAVYTPHAGHSHEDLDTFYAGLNLCLEDALRNNLSISVGGDFNTQLGQGIRGDMLENLCCNFNLAVANGGVGAVEEDGWTFQSSMGIRRRIDFILASQRLCIQNCNAVNLIDLGSDHRAVHAHFLMSKGPPRTGVCSKREGGGNL